VPLLTNLRRKMSNKRDRRRKGVIYPGQSGTGRSQNTFFTETGKEPFVCRERGIIMNVFETINQKKRPDF
jgi:hypothetical protein